MRGYVGQPHRDQKRPIYLPLDFDAGIDAQADSGEGGVIQMGNPGLGKTHIAISLALAACRQSRRARFMAAGLVNELIEAQDQHRLPRLLRAAFKQYLMVLDEFGFIL